MRGTRNMIGEILSSSIDFALAHSEDELCSNHTSKSETLLSVDMYGHIWPCQAKKSCQSRSALQQVHPIVLAGLAKWRVACPTLHVIDYRSRFSWNGAMRH